MSIWPRTSAGQAVAAASCTVTAPTPAPWTKRNHDGAVEGGEETTDSTVISVLLRLLSSILRDTSAAVADLSGRCTYHRSVLKTFSINPLEGEGNEERESFFEISKFGRGANLRKWVGFN